MTEYDFSFLQLRILRSKWFELTAAIMHYGHANALQ